VIFSDEEILQIGILVYLCRALKNDSLIFIVYIRSWRDVKASLLFFFICPESHGRPLKSEKITLFFAGIYFYSIFA